MHSAEHREHGSDVVTPAALFMPTVGVLHINTTFLLLGIIVGFKFFFQMHASSCVFLG